MNSWTARWREFRLISATSAAPLLLLLLLAVAPFFYRAVSPGASLRLSKVAILVAFSGPLQARGNDLSAAIQIAVQHANAGDGRTLAVVSALDDQGQTLAASDQARGVAADPGIHAVLCCTTAGALAAVAALLPARESLISLLGTPSTMPNAEATLLQRQFGSGAVVVLSDRTSPEDARAGTLAPALRSLGDTVNVVTADFATGSNPDRVAEAVAQHEPSLVVLDMDYPAAAILAPALRTAGVHGPLVGDDRLDGAPAAALLSSVGAVWYVALDRDALLHQTPTTFAGDFSRMRGHPPSGRDVLAYLQARVALHTGVAPIDPERLPLVLYQIVPGVYPGRVGLSGGAGQP